MIFVTSILNTITFSMGSDKPEDDKLNYARLIVEKFNTDHKEIKITSKEIKNLKKS